MMNLRSLISVFFLSAAAFAPQIASAQFGLSSSSNSDASGSIGIVPVSSHASNSHTGIVGPVSSSIYSNAGGFYQEGGGNASGTANYGSLQATAGSYGQGGGGSSDNTSRWFDTVTITSTMLPVGSPVTLLATAHYTGTLTAFLDNGFYNDPVSWDGKATVTFQSDIGTLPLSYNASLDLTMNASHDYLSQSLPIDQTIQQSITTYVGATLPLDSQIDISTIGYATGNFKASGGGRGDVASVFDVQSQTAGVTLIRASSAAPAPSALVTVLLGAGMFGLVTRLRRPFAVRW